MVFLLVKYYFAWTKLSQFIHVLSCQRIEIFLNFFHLIDPLCIAMMPQMRLNFLLNFHPDLLLPRVDDQLHFLRIKKIRFCFEVGIETFRCASHFMRTWSLLLSFEQFYVYFQRWNLFVYSVLVSCSVCHGGVGPFGLIYISGLRTRIFWSSLISLYYRHSSMLLSEQIGLSKSDHGLILLIFPFLFISTCYSLPFLMHFIPLRGNPHRLVNGGLRQMFLFVVVHFGMIGLKSLPHRYFTFLYLFDHMFHIDFVDGLCFVLAVFWFLPGAGFLEEIFEEDYWGVLHYFILLYVDY